MQADTHTLKYGDVPSSCNDFTLPIELSHTIWHNIQILQNVFQTCIPCPIFYNFPSTPLTYQRWLFLKHPVFFMHLCHCTDYSSPLLLLLTNPYPSFMYIGENPPPPHPTFLYHPIEKENAHDTLADIFGIALHHSHHS